MDYDPANYWNAVGDEMRLRGDNVVAGDDTPFFRYKRARFVSEFLGSLDVGERTVLEIGSGPGGNLDVLAQRRPMRLAGVDVAPSMVSLARARGHEVVQIDGRALPFGDCEFQVVFAATVLQHNSRVDELLTEMCRVTSERLVLFEDVAGCHLRESDAYVRRSPWEYATVANACGFDLVAQQPLRIYGSEFVHRVLMRLFEPRSRREGEPIRAFTRRSEQALLPLTARLDPLVPARRTLSRMVFAPRA